MFNHVFDDMTGSTLNFYPQSLQTEIDTLSTTIDDRSLTLACIYVALLPNNWPTTLAVHQLFDTLDIRRKAGEFSVFW